MFDPPTASVDGNQVGYDPRWAMFVALGLSVLLIVAGVRGRRMHHAGEGEAQAADADAAPTVSQRGR
jgi:hypothetical protein